MAQKQSYTSSIENKNHSFVARTLKNALTLGHFEAWGAFATVAASRLDDQERAAMAFATLKSQAPDHAEMTFDAAIYGITPESFIDTPAGRAAILEWRVQRDRRRAR